MAERFPGFRSPNYTQVPDELFDELMAELSGAELKVLLYIIRRTFGFKRDSDNISISQMLNGITTATGRRLDNGTGLARSSLLRVLKSLEDRSIIIPTRRGSSVKGHEATNYRLNIIGQSRKPTPTPPGSFPATPPCSRPVRLRPPYGRSRRSASLRSAPAKAGGREHERYRPSASSSLGSGERSGSDARARNPRQSHTTAV